MIFNTINTELTTYKLNNMNFFIIISIYFCLNLLLYIIPMPFIYLIYYHLYRQHPLNYHQLYMHYHGFRSNQDLFSHNTLKIDGHIKCQVFRQK